MPDPRSAFHSATLSTESNADLISINISHFKLSINPYNAAIYLVSTARNYHFFAELPNAVSTFTARPISL